MNYPMPAKIPPSVRSNRLWYVTDGGILTMIGTGGVVGMACCILDETKNGRIHDTYGLMDPLMQADLVLQIENDFLSEFRK